MQERRQNARGIRKLRARKERGGGVTPRRITEKQNPPQRKAGSESKSEEGDTRIKRKSIRRKEDKNEKKGTRNGTRRTTKRRGKKKRRKKKGREKRGKEKENGKGVRAVLC